MFLEFFSVTGYTGCMMKDNAGIHEAGENYLETILILEDRGGRARAVDIAAERGCSKPTISVALKKLAESGYITADADGTIRLTPAGREIAEQTYERHRVLSTLLKALGVSDRTAYADACKIEHDLSQESFDCIRRYYDKTKK